MCTGVAHEPASSHRTVAHRGSEYTSACAGRCVSADASMQTGSSEDSGEASPAPSGLDTDEGVSAGDSAPGVGDGSSDCGESTIDGSTVGDSKGGTPKGDIPAGGDSDMKSSVLDGIGVMGARLIPTVGVARIEIEGTGVSSNAVGAGVSKSIESETEGVIVMGKNTVTIGVTVIGTGVGTTVSTTGVGVSKLSSGVGAIVIGGAMGPIEPDGVGVSVGREDRLGKLVGDDDGDTAAEIDADRDGNGVGLGILVGDVDGNMIREFDADGEGNGVRLGILAGDVDGDAAIESEADGEGNGVELGKKKKEGEAERKGIGDRLGLGLGVEAADSHVEPSSMGSVGTADWLQETQRDPRLSTSEQRSPKEQSAEDAQLTILGGIQTQRGSDEVQNDR